MELIFCRNKLRIGDPTIRGWAGDCLLVACCSCCVQCQMTRSLPREAWDWPASLSRVECYLDPCLFTTQRYADDITEGAVPLSLMRDDSQQNDEYQHIG